MEFNSLPTKERIKKVLEAVNSRAVKAQLVETREEALEKVKSMIPGGADVMTGASITLQQIGFEDLLVSGKHPWHNLKDGILAEKDMAKQATLRKQGTMSEYFLGSVHAIAETGEIVIASATGSQLPAYAFSSSNVIWVAGAQKITPSLEMAIKRIREYIVPLEDQHMKQIYGPQAGTMIGKMLIFERESPMLHRNVNLILVNEVLGF
jgi:L-lactate utilization protein LutC